VLEKETPVGSRVTPFAILKYNYATKTAEVLAPDFSMGNITNIQFNPDETHAVFESLWGLNVCLVESRINVFNLVGNEE